MMHSSATAKAIRSNLGALESWHLPRHSEIETRENDAANAENVEEA